MLSSSRQELRTFLLHPYLWGLTYRKNNNKKPGYQPRLDFPILRKGAHRSRSSCVSSIDPDPPLPDVAQDLYTKSQIQHKKHVLLQTMQDFAASTRQHQLQITQIIQIIQIIQITQIIQIRDRSALNDLDHQIRIDGLCDL